MLRKIIDKAQAETFNQIVTCNMSSSICSRNLSKENLWQEMGVVYADSRMNFGAQGLTFVMVRDDVLQKVRES